MKTLKYIMLSLIVFMIPVMEGNAKQVKAGHMYMFGFSASFKDSTVYVTNIQDVQGAWYNNKNKFLMGRDNYSYQFKEYLKESQGKPQRICIVFFDTNKKKAEKKYLKLKKKYTEKAPGMYEVIYLTEADFKFSPIDYSPSEE